MAENSYRSWFNVLNNPEWYITYKTDDDNKIVYDVDGKKIEVSREPSEFNGMTPEEICDAINKKWCDGSVSRTCAAAYCISASGLHHVHFVTCDSAKCRFNTVKNCFPRAHIESTAGNKQQAENYIHKKGGYAEKGEQVICIKYQGEICSNQGHRSDLDAIEQYIKDGYKPDYITSQGIRFLSKESLIKNAYYKKRAAETPVIRDVSVFYHYGLSGTGKSFTFSRLCEKFGEDEVYFIGNYDNGFLDEYNGQKIIFLDEFRGQIRYATLLSICQGYKQYFHARNHNILGLWSEVHITSVIPPELLYKKLLSDDSHDVIDQFIRRITGIFYHYRDRMGEFHEKYIPREKYNGFNSCFTEDNTPFVQLSLVSDPDLPW